MEGHVVKGVGQSLKLSSEFYSASLYVFQFSSVPQAYLALCNLMDRKSQASLSVINPWGLLKCMSIESVMPSSHIILCHPLLLPPSIFRSIDVFSNESFASGGQSIRVSASASGLPQNIQDSAFFIVHLSHPYMTTEKTIALNRWTFAGKVFAL